MARNEYVITAQKSLAVVPVQAFVAQQERILKSAANSYASKARQLAMRRMPGSNSPGKITQQLRRSIQRGAIYKREWGSGMRMACEVVCNLAETPADRDDSGFSYAIAQEYGTGLHGPKKRMIKPKAKRIMTWEQKNEPYIGRLYIDKNGNPYRKVTAKLIRFQWAPGKHVNPKLAQTLGRRASAAKRKVNKVYQQYALEVSGVQAKHFMRDSMKEPETTARLKRELAALTKAALKSTRPLNLTGLQLELMSPTLTHYTPPAAAWPKFD